MTLEEMVKNVVSHYNDDPSAPCVKVSFVNDEWYCVVERYNGPFGSRKQRVCAESGATLEEALTKLDVSWLVNR